MRSSLILHIDHSGLPGGGQLGLQRYAEAPSAFERHYCFLEGGPVAEAMRNAGHAVTIRSGGTSLISLIRSRRGLNDAVEQLQPVAIIANSLRSAVALALARPSAPLIYYVRQDMSVGSMGRITSMIANRLIFPRFSAFIANSKWTMTTIPSRLRQSRRIEVAYPISGVSQVAKPQPTRSGKPLRLLWVGRIAQWKGLHVLLEALRILDHRNVDYHLTVAGAPIHEGASYESDVREKAVALRNAPDFLGHVSDVAALMEDHDVLVHTSTRPEPFGQVVVQGMSAGMVVIATDAGGPREMINAGIDGYLVDPDDPARLADRLSLVYNLPPSNIQDIGARAQQAVMQRFDDTVLARSFDQAISTLIDGFQ